MTIQPVSALVAAIVSFAIGGSVLLREPRRRAHVLFATFTFNIALYSLLSFVAKRFDAPLFSWASLLVAVSLPATAQRFFQAFLGDDAGPPPLSRSTVVGAAIFYTVLGFSRFIEPLHATVWFGVAFTAYVFAGLYLSVYYLYRRYRATPSRIEKTRLLYLVVGGIATVTSALLEAIPRGPSFGNVFIIVYLYFLSQNLIRYRLLDLNELLGRMVVLGTLVFILTAIYGVLVRWVGPDEQGLFFFNTLLASATIVILIEPLRTRVEGGISRWMFQEKFELSRRIEMLRAEMANVIDMRVLVPRVLGALEDSRRITHASIYLADPDGSGFELSGHVGPRPEGRFDAITQRAFFERLRRAGVISLEGIEREVTARRTASTEEQESLQVMLRTLEQMNGSVALGFSSEDQLLGVLVIRDDRLREAYSTDEIELFRGVATSIGITLQNSQVYERMKERDRLAALGQMAAGLAHEIRNPLGSIKGAAQFLIPGQLTEAGRESTREGTREFLDIIVEEVNRLNKIVSQFLDYARPYRGEQRPLEVADVLRKTLSLLTKETEEQGKVDIVTDFAERLPPVRADAEQLLQVFLNLSLNALQAMPQGGRLLISTGLRRATRRGAAAAFFEVRFRDTGVGIPPGDIKNLFIPFFTTKDKGTGLGLPISQRIIENHGGTIEVRSQPGEGATFTVLLPIEADVYAAYLESIRVETSRTETTRRGPPPLPPPGPPAPPPPGSPGRLPPPAPRRTPPPGVERGKLPAVTAATPEVKRVLVADDELNMRRVLEAMLRREGYDVVTAANGIEALGGMSANVHTVITDLKMPGLDGMALLKRLSVDYPDVPVVMITAHGSVENAVEAVKLGAFDYLEKPFEQEQIRQVVAKAINTFSLSRRDARPEEPSGRGRFRLVGQSPAIRQIFGVVEKVANTPSTVLITGESGTGKELIARALHENSSRHAGPFIKINCAAIPKTLMESELFGYDKGAFTGAVGAKPGRFELAHGGTLFLDEIGEIPIEMQVKLLRVLQESEFERVGGIKTIKVDVRLVTATNRDLQQEIAAGNFRDDLFYRLNVVPIHIPPLRERHEDIPLLVEHFLAKFNERLKKQIGSVAPDAVDRLVGYTWPGNIRELENLMERTILFCEGPTIQVSDLPPEVVGAPLLAPGTPTSLPVVGGALDEAGRPAASSLKEAVRAETERVERDLIQRALDATGGNVTQAARKLKISRKSLQTKMKELGLRTGG